MIQYQWRTIQDPFGAGNFAISPYTGHLVTLDFDTSHPMDRLLGFKDEQRRVDQYFDKRSILDSAVFTATSEAEPNKRMQILVANFLWFLPLAAAITLLDKIYIFRTSMKVSVDDAVAITARTFGSRSNKDCLAVSLCRYLFLKQMGIPANINIGVLVPTGKMHAWIEIDGHPCLECKDVLMHYQSCLKFSAASVNDEISLGDTSVPYISSR